MPLTPGDIATVISAAAELDDPEVVLSALRYLMEEQYDFEIFVPEDPDELAAWARELANRVIYDARYLHKHGVWPLRRSESDQAEALEQYRQFARQAYRILCHADPDKPFNIEYPGGTLVLDRPPVVPANPGRPPFMLVKQTPDDWQ